MREGAVKAHVAGFSFYGQEFADKFAVSVNVIGVEIHLSAVGLPHIHVLGCTHGRNNSRSRAVYRGRNHLSLIFSPGVACLFCAAAKNIGKNRVLLLRTAIHVGYGNADLCVFVKAASKQGCFLSLTEPCRNGDGNTARSMPFHHVFSLLARCQDNTALHPFR